MVAHFNSDCVYFAARKTLTATAWLELLCHQHKAWQKRSKNKRKTVKLNPNPNPNPLP